MRKVKVNTRNCFRAILTDTLPYEVPMFFTNEQLYTWLSDQNKRNSFPTEISSLLSRKARTKPFSYKVRKSGGGHRKLSVPHPSAQARFAELYGEFDAFIENVCSRSAFSLRYPSRVGSYFYQSQFSTSTRFSTQIDADPASFETQREWASSYFYYKRFNHIQKFFSSNEFFQLEQKYSFMLKLDIARCFESIYTHSISWAVRGKEFGKQHKSRLFFESEFDDRMQDANWGETSGILIGPEVSRVFAEAIMQSIDVELARRLKEVDGSIEVARYVDDFFLFSNSESLLRTAQRILEDIAAQFNLHFNQSKTQLINRPFVSSFTIARERVTIALTSFLKSANRFLSEESQSEQFSQHLAEKTLAEIRRIARENNVDYSVLASPALAVLAKGGNEIQERVPSKPAVWMKKRLQLVSESLMHVATFFYLMDIRATTSDKLSRILLECSKLIEKSATSRLAFEGRIQDTLQLALAQSRLCDITGPEIINVLIAADAICKSSSAVTKDVLLAALGFKSNNFDPARLNYFELSASLYFAKDRHSFRALRKSISTELEKRVCARGAKLGDYSEETLMFFDYISCPYIPVQSRLELFSRVCVSLGSTSKNQTLRSQFNLVSRTIRFTAWDGARNFQAMLARRELQPAYTS